MTVYRVTTTTARGAVRMFDVATARDARRDLGAMLIDHLGPDERIITVDHVRHADDDEALLLAPEWSRSEGRNQS